MAKKSEESKFRRANSDDKKQVAELVKKNSVLKAERDAFVESIEDWHGWRERVIEVERVLKTETDNLEALKKQLTEINAKELGYKIRQQEQIVSQWRNAVDNERRNGQQIEDNFKFNFKLNLDGLAPEKQEKLVFKAQDDAIQRTLKTINDDIAKFEAEIREIQERINLEDWILKNVRYVTRNNFDMTKLPDNPELEKVIKIQVFQFLEDPGIFLADYLEFTNSIEFLKAKEYKKLSGMPYIKKMLQVYFKINKFFNKWALLKEEPDHGQYFASSLGKKLYGYEGGILEMDKNEKPALKVEEKVIVGSYAKDTRESITFDERGFPISKP